MQTFYANNIYIGKTIHIWPQGSGNMALHLLLTKNICHHVKHASPTIHVITFQLLIRSKNDYEITVKEALYNEHKKTTINTQLCTQGTSFALKIFCN